MNRSTYLLISTHICHKPKWQNWLGLHSADSMVVGSNPAACSRLDAKPLFLQVVLFKGICNMYILEILVTLIVTGQRKQAYLLSLNQLLFLGLEVVLQCKGATKLLACHTL